MATAKKSTPPKSARAKSARSPNDKKWRVAVILVLAVAVLGYAYRGPVLGYSQAGTAYGARVACSCRYVDGRELQSCRQDMERGMGIVFLSEDESSKSVTARVPLLASTTARYRKGWGCVLENWDE